MKYSEEHTNLFNVSSDYVLAHCISADYALGAGIALQFAQRGVKNYLIEQEKNGCISQHWKGNGYCLFSVDNDERFVYNLVTKEKFWKKPTYTTMRQALEDMKGMLAANKNNKLAMPLIGCGLDYLNWDKVSEIIKDVFKDTSMEIKICYLHE